MGRRVSLRRCCCRTVRGAHSLAAALGMSVCLLVAEVLISDSQRLCTDGLDLTHFTSDRCHWPIRSAPTLPQNFHGWVCVRDFRYVRHAVWVRLKEKTTAQEIVIGPPSSEQCSRHVVAELYGTMQ